MTFDLFNAKLLTVGQVAKLLHVHQNTVRRWSNNGIINSYRICKRGDRRFKKEDVVLLFESWLPGYGQKNVKHEDNLLVHV